MIRRFSWFPAVLISLGMLLDTSWATTTTPPTDQALLDLSGRWHFWPQDDSRFAAPRTATDTAHQVTVPGMWLRDSIDYDGTAWYRRTVTLATTGDYAVLTPAILLAFEGYWNGRKICALGEITDNGDLLRRGLGRVVCRIPETIQNVGDNTLAFRVRSEFGWGGFEFGGFYFGPTSAIIAELNRDLMHYGAVAAALLMFGIYHLVLFGARRQERAYYAFSLLSLGMAGYVSGIKGLMLLWVDSFWAAAVPFYACIAITPYAMPVFFHGLFDFPRGRMVRIGFWLTVVNVILLVASPISEFAYGNLFIPWIPILSLGTVIYVGYVLYLTARAVQQRKTGAVLALVGFGIVGGAIVHDVLIRNGLLHRGTIVEDAYLVWIATLAIAMARKIAGLHSEADRLNTRLETALVHTKAFADAVARFVPTSFVQLLRRDDVTQLTAGDHSERRMAVLFVDLRGFTKRSQELGAERTFELLNQTLEQLVPAIEAKSGFVDKYLGDGIMALFDDDTLNGSAPTHAVDATVAMLMHLHAFNTRLRARDMAPLELSFGIHWGPLMLGTVGNTRRLDTTAIGNTVNLAARIEALNRTYRTRILVSEDLFQRLSESSSWQAREIDHVRVAGSREPMKIYQVETPGRAKHWADPQAWRTGLDEFRAGRFDDAAYQFEKLASNFPEDAQVAVYLERCTTFKYLPPKNWDGVFVFSKK